MGWGLWLTNFNDETLLWICTGNQCLPITETVGFP